MYSFEIVYINDGSTDNTLEKMENVANLDKNVQVIDLSRNYGKEIAMLAGLEHTTGEATIIMDSDLQHPPEKIPELIHMWEMGYQDVYGKRVTRHKESMLKIYSSKLYYKILSFLSQTKIEDGIGDFRLLDKECVQALISFRDKQRYTKGLYNEIGFKKIGIEFEANERFAGESKWSTQDLIKLAKDGILSNSLIPLKLSTYFGTALSLSAFVYFLYTLVRALLGKTTLPGYSSLMIVLLIIGGVQLISLGVLGEYVGNIFKESKDRPIYLINKKNSIVKEEQNSGK
ncbi:glycosyltransferase family 2 protein [Vagococcus xieshaowenii]|nr:glycosyltransferase family 2 protein [Vagococcus xieshaowenii]